MKARDKLTDWLKTRKDSSVSFMVETLLRKRLEAYGRVLEFDLNSRQRQAAVKILLRGETEPVTLNVVEYGLVADANCVSLTILRATGSRPWLTQLLEEFVVGRSFPIPEKYSSVVKMLL